MRNYYSAPVLTDISITKRCNLKCDYCSASSCPNYEREKELSISDFACLFDELDKLHVHRISLGGGEPFIRDDFFKILEVAHTHDFSIIINTNGTLIDNKIAKELTKYRFDRICVTLDGSNKEIHERHRGKDTFNRVIRGINFLKEQSLPVSTLFTLTKDNAQDLINTIRFNEKLGMQYMSTMMMCPTGRASDGNLLVDKCIWYPLFMQLTKMLLNKDINLKFKIVPPNESAVFWLFYCPLEYYKRLDLLYLWNQDLNIPLSKREISCTAGIKAMSVDQNGDVYGCDFMMGIKEFIAGNIRKNSVKEIWDTSPVFKRFREIEFSQLTGKCSNCDKRWCGGGCRSAAYNLSGQYSGADESCFLEV